jgi:hypothetical protein
MASDAETASSSAPGSEPSTPTPSIAPIFARSSATRHPTLQEQIAALTPVQTSSQEVADLPRLLQQGQIGGDSAEAASHLQGC